MGHRILWLNSSVEALLTRSNVRQVIIPGSFSLIVFAIATDSLLPVRGASAARRLNAALAFNAFCRSVNAFRHLFQHTGISQLLKMFPHISANQQAIGILIFHNEVLQNSGGDNFDNKNDGLLL